MSNERDPGSLIVSTLEKAWRDIQVRHPEVPNVIFITGTGMVKDGVKWGHFHAEQWITESGRIHELFVSGEALNREPVETMTTLLHEAAHGVCFEKGIKGTSRRGKYHNQRFVKECEGLGLMWPEGQKPDTTRGFSAVVMRPETIEAYAVTIEALKEGRAAWKELGLAPADEAKPKSINTKPKAECACPGRYIWTAAKTLEENPVICGGCDTEFMMVG
ncbi:hypothetical protein [Streptomyces yunnanensis]|uniref:SprT-like family protein n=1 Tax=Streptomyces yunnanensis TaxID=156453 RepID=A0A9X8N7Z3_9ACTN|nr:hypothetical protein [Streptomyces yunnanensis]SHN24891.1 hypothetical protein SAMN05216268_126150 [Streptomyces yunnanensis]